MYPILFRIGPVPVFAYGAAMAVGFMAALSLVRRWSAERGWDPEGVADSAFVSVLAGIAGARLLFILIEWRYFLHAPMAAFKLWEGGLVFYGGLMAAIPVGIWSLRRKGIPVGEAADVMAPAVAIAHAIGRIGCCLNGCCYGLPSPAWGWVVPSLQDGIPRVPVQSIEAVGLVGLAWGLRRAVWKSQPPGRVFFMYVMCYGGWRFLLEFFRADDRGPMGWGWLSISQAISLILVAVSLRWWFRRTSSPS